MKIKHTPKPWHVGMQPGPIVYGPKGEQVADMRNGMLHHDEDVANIHLIAAAPDLYEACVAYKKAYFDRADDDMEFSKEAKAIIKAIAKAEGNV